MRTLLVRERVVPADRTAAYHDAWKHVAYTAGMIGIRAWIFRSAATQDHYLEFVEWKAEAAPPGTGDVAPPAGMIAVLHALDMIAPA